jgi:hypothetical protein
MICANGEQKTPVGETGIFFFCYLEENKGNVCQFVRWCHQTCKYEASTDKNGNTCKHFYVNILSLK